jgi:polysaccharide biosynthesis transport protein
VLAFLLERLDRSAQTSRDVELAIGRPVIGSVPKFSWRFRRGQWALVMANGRSSKSLQPAREAYRRLRSSLLFLAKVEGARTIVVTSSQALEGKSTTAANLAATLALGGTKVALISADLRRPSLERLLGVSNETGLSNYLNGETDTIRVEIVSGFESLFFVPSGREPRNPGELLGSSRFADVVATLYDQVEIVVIDTPPLGAAADALSVAGVADGVIVVVDGKRTETTDLLSIRNELDRSGARLFGAVLNRDSSQRRGFLRRRNQYSYYASERGQDQLPTTSIGRRVELTPVRSVAESSDPTRRLTPAPLDSGRAVQQMSPMDDPTVVELRDDEALELAVARPSGRRRLRT